MLDFESIKEKQKNKTQPRKSSLNWEQIYAKNKIDTSKPYVSESEKTKQWEKEVNAKAENARQEALQKQGGEKSPSYKTTVKPMPVLHPVTPKTADKSIGERVGSGLKSIGYSAAAALPYAIDTVSYGAEEYLSNIGNEKYVQSKNRLAALEKLKNKMGYGSDIISPQEEAIYEMPGGQVSSQREIIDRGIENATEAAENSMIKVKRDEDRFGSKMKKRQEEEQEKAMEGLEGIPAFLGGVALSMGTNIAAMPTALVGGPAAPLAAMGLMAANDRQSELEKEGYTVSEGMGRSFASGGVEMLTEKIPLENLFRLGKGAGEGALKEILKQAGIEAAEESASYMANYALDVLAEDPNAEFSVYELMENAAAGALSGGLFGAAGNAFGKVTATDPRVSLIREIAASEDNEMQKDIFNFQPQTATGAEKAVRAEVRADEPLRENYTQRQENTAQAVSEAAENGGAAYGEKGRRAFEANVTQETDGRAFDAYYRAGRESLPMETVEGFEGTASDIKYAAYSAGQNDAAEKPAYSGRSGFVGNPDVKIDRKTRTLLNNTAKALGVRVVMDKGDDGRINGYYDYGKNEIHISPNDSDAVYTVFKHELTHVLEKNAPAEYAEYRDYVIKSMKEGYGRNFDATAEIYRNEYRKTGQELTDDDLFREMAADYTAEILKDGEKIERLALYKPSVASRIFTFIKGIVGRIKSFFGEKSEEYTYLKKAEELYGNALKAAKENTKAQQGNAEKGDRSLSVKGTENLIAENELLRRENDRLKKEFETTGGRQVKERAVKRKTAEILKVWESKMDFDEAESSISDLYDTMGSGEINYASAETYAYAIAREIISQAETVHNDMAELYKYARREIRQTAVYISPEDRADIQMGYKEFKNRYSGRIKLRENGLPIDVFYESLAENYPEMFSIDITHPADQLQRIGEFWDMTEPVRENPYTAYIDHASETLKNEILNAYMELPKKVTFADRAQRRLELERARGAARVLKERIRGEKRTEKAVSSERKKRQRESEKLRQKIREMAERNRQKIKDVRAEERLNAAVRRGVERDAFRAAIEEMGDKNRAVNKILDIAQTFRRWAKGDRPQGLLGHDALDGFVKQLSKMKYRSDIRKASARKIIASLDEFYSEKILGRAAEGEYYNPKIKEDIEFLKENIYSKDKNGEIKTDKNGEKIVNQKQLTYEEVLAAERVVGAIKKLYETYDRIFFEGKSRALSEVAANCAEILRRHSDNRTKGLNFLTNKLIKTSYISSSVDPETVIKMLENFDEKGVLTALWSDITKGETAGMAWAARQREKVRAFYDAHKGYQKSLGDAVEIRGHYMTKNEMIYLYLLSLREQARPALFSELGGIRFTDAKTKEVVTMTQLMSETDSEIKEVYERFSDDDKAFIDLLNELFNRDLAERKREADFAIMGYTNVSGDKNYVPIVRDRAKIRTAFSDASSTASYIQGVYNFSFNKALKINSKLQLELIPIDELLNNHINKLAQYIFLTEPLKNFDKVLSKNISQRFVEKENGERVQVGMETVRDCLEKIWPKYDAYFRKLMLDIQGRSQMTREKWLSRLSRNFATSVLGANISTALAQISAYPMALVDLDWSSVVKGAALWQRETGGAHVVKDMVKYSDWAAARVLENGIVLGEGGFDKELSKAADKTTAGIQMMDNFAVGLIWKACQFQAQKDTGYAVGTSQNKFEAAAILEKVGRRTQANHMPSEKSAFMRSDNEIVRSLMMFTTDAMKQFSRMVEDFGRWQACAEACKKDKSEKAVRRRKEAKKAFVKTMTSTLIANAAFAAVKEVASSLLSGKPDDEDEDKWEAIVKRVMMAYVSYLPFVRDIVSNVSEGYDTENYTYSVLNDVSDLIRAVGKAAADPSFEKIMAIRYPANSVVASLTAIPVNNIDKLRQFLVNKVYYGAIYSLAGQEKEGKLRQYEKYYPLWKTANRSRYYDLLEEAIDSGDDEMADMISDLLLTTEGITVSSINQNMKTRRREKIEAEPEYQKYRKMLEDYYKNGGDSGKVGAAGNEAERQLTAKGHSEDDVQYVLKKLEESFVKEQAPTKNQLIALYDAAQSDKSKKAEYAEAVSAMIESGYKEEEIAQIISAHERMKKR